jgi:N-methylhydantoinase A
VTWRVGVDIGGTFTDVAVVDDQGKLVIWKEDTTPAHPERAVQDGLSRVASLLGLDVGAFLSKVSPFVHGSTVATNTIIQRRGPRLGLVCTEGFRDVLYLRDGFKWDRFNPGLERPADFVPRYLRRSVRERIDARGNVVRPLDEDDVRAVAAALRDHRVETVAVALLWSLANPVHELRVREILQEELPSVPVLLSSDVLPELGEWVRTSATVLSAFVFLASQSYLRSLERWLADAGLETRPLIMQVNGGCATVEQTLRVPVSTIASGPAAAPAAALQVGRRVSARDMITVDMGGTSFDVCLIKDGEVPRSRAIAVAHQPIGIPGVEVHSIGAGGGSIAWIDAGGALRIGPQSAGARPGPAAYGLGGGEPTVTDANIVLGYLAPEAFLGGRRALSPELSEQAIRTRVARPLGLDLVQAAAGIIKLVNENMVNAIGVVSVERGIDPRPFLLVAGGGAGALHAGRLAAQLQIRRVLIPAEAGTISAYGMTVSDVRHDYAGALHTISTEPDTDGVGTLLEQLEVRALEELAEAGFGRQRVRLQRFVDARYVGQVHELLVPVRLGQVDQATFAEIVQSFHESHSIRYGWASEQRAVEFLHWRVTGFGVIDVHEERRFDELPRVAAEGARRSARRAYFDELGGFSSVPVYSSADFPAGGALRGPAFVDADTTTVVVFPDQHLVGDGRGSFLLETGMSPAGAGGG